MFNLRNKKCQQLFKDYTSKEKSLSNCFRNNETLNTQFNKWQKLFNKALYACFRRIRIPSKEKKVSEIDVLMEEKRKVIRKKNHDIKIVEELDKQLSEACEEREWEKLVKVLGSLETDHGSTNNTNVWREMKKAYPKKLKPLSTGVKNIEGKVITNPDEKKNIILKHFLHRMRRRSTKEEFKEIININEDTFRLRIEMSKSKKSDPISMNELNKALKSLKLGKTRDPQSWVCELFKDGIIGTDLRMSLLMMFNKVKDEVHVPDCFRTAHITMIHKKNVN